jgi:hypothetical protein
MFYGVIALVVFLIAQISPMHLSIPIIVLGVVITVYGFVLLYRFIRRYPKVEPKVDFDDPCDSDTETSGGNEAS